MGVLWVGPRARAPTPALPTLRFAWGEGADHVQYNMRAVGSLAAISASKNPRSVRIVAAS